MRHCFELHSRGRSIIKMCWGLIPWHSNVENDDLQGSLCLLALSMGFVGGTETGMLYMVLKC